MSSPLEVLLAERYADKQEPKVQGVLTAKVTGRMGDGAYELQYLSMSQNAPSAPARVMVPTAGNKRGSYAMPEVGDEVVVAFDGGDTNNPIILGALWNDDSKTPEQAKPSDENNLRTFVSRSGHEVTFDDTSAAEQVRICSKSGHKIVLDDKPPGKITITSPKGALIEVDEATMTLTIRSTTAIKIETAALTLAAGSVSMGPPAPGSAIPAPPQPTSISNPISIAIESNAISLKAAMIELTTTGNAATSMVVIDGKPFGTHTHNVLPTPPTGPVTP